MQSISVQAAHGLYVCIHTHTPIYSAVICCSAGSSWLLSWHSYFHSASMPGFFIEVAMFRATLSYPDPPIVGTYVVSSTPSHEVSDYDVWVHYSPLSLPITSAEFRGNFDQIFGESISRANHGLRPPYGGLSLSTLLHSIEPVFEHLYFFNSPTGRVDCYSQMFQGTSSCYWTHPPSMRHSFCADVA